MSDFKAYLASDSDESDLDDDEDGMQDGTVAFLILGGTNQTITQLSNSPVNNGSGQIGVRAFEDPAELARYAGSTNTEP